MTDANTNQADPATASSRSFLAIAAIGAAFVAGALWWRYGESVFLASMMSTIIACF
jgi:hypothetical protein